ncbi:major facilitator superfamily domain-containing protein [Geopyxis carbonaria]|nr:major facilitator superfamily domain-containing protein [Geopyxis carbonaria]
MSSTLTQTQTREVAPVELAEIPPAAGNYDVHSDGTPPDDPGPTADAPNKTVNALRLISANLCFLTAGINDGSLGALVPYIKSHYGIGTGLVAIIYIPTFLGWLTAALTLPLLHRPLGTRGLLFLGALLQLIAQIIRATAPPYPLFACSFFLAGLGIAFQDSTANTYIASAPLAHRWLGLVHAMYGLGCLVAPLLATGIATAAGGRWNLFYTAAVGIGALNVVLVGVAFRGYRSEKSPQSPRKQMGEVLRMRAVWTLSAFYFCYLGAVITISGWVVDFLITVRSAPLSTAGYLPMSFFGGVTLSRLALAEPTHRYGERRMILLYLLLALGAQLVFWLVPNLAANAVALGVLGFMLGPLFATGVSVATKLVPAELHTAALGWIFVVGQAGGAVWPALTGVVAAKHGVGVLQPVAVGLMVATAGVWAMVPKGKGRDE